MCSWFDIIFFQIDDDFLAHYQLSYGFNSCDNAESVNNVNADALKIKPSDVKNIENKPESGLHVSNKSSETEKRKLPQPSEPSIHKYNVK